MERRHAGRPAYRIVVQAVHLGGSHRAGHQSRNDDRLHEPDDHNGRQRALELRQYQLRDTQHRKRHHRVVEHWLLPTCRKSDPCRHERDGATPRGELRNAEPAYCHAGHGERHAPRYGESLRHLCYRRDATRGGSRDEDRGQERQRGLRGTDQRRGRACDLRRGGGCRDQGASHGFRIF